MSPAGPAVPPCRAAGRVHGSRTPGPCLPVAGSRAPLKYRAVPPPARRGEQAAPFEGGRRLSSLPCVCTEARVGVGVAIPPSDLASKRSPCAWRCVHVALCVAGGLYRPSGVSGGGFGWKDRVRCKIMLCICTQSLGITDNY